MNIVPTNMTIADYCQAMARGEIVVNSEYQRSDKVWPQVAKSYLIETIILSYPVPKLSLHQITDLKSRKTLKEIVDGQQRSRAIQDFYKDDLRLLPSLDSEEIAGRVYSELQPDLQQKFLDFSLSLDLFVSATRDEVVEVFRRMNSYTIPLNPEEQRHASFQGKFKWFINRIAKRFGKGFLDMGLFGEKQLVRMADTKLLSEICDAFFNGIRTTNKQKLDRLYKDKDKQFPEEADLGTRITEAVDKVRGWTDIHGGPLMKPHIIYALTLAFLHVRRTVPTLEEDFRSPRLRKFNDQAIIANMSALSEALEEPERSGEFRDFAQACASKTNVREQRIIRFRWMCRALTSESLP